MGDDNNEKNYANGIRELQLDKETKDRLKINDDLSNRDDFDPENYDPLKDVPGEESGKKEEGEKEGEVETKESDTEKDKDKSKKQTTVSSESDEEKGSDNESSTQEPGETKDSSTEEEQPSGESEEDQETDKEEGEEEEDKTKQTFLTKVNDVLKEKLEDDDRAEKVAKVVETIAGYDEENSEQFLKDFQDWDKFTASNTQRAQQLAQRENAIVGFEVLQDLSKKVKSEEFQDSLKKLSEREDYQDFLDSTDDYFEVNKNENPVRKIFETLTNHSQDFANASEKQGNISKKEADLKLEEEILELRKMANKDGDNQYDSDDSEELVSLGEFADRRKVDLKTAYEIKRSQNIENNYQKQLSEKDSKINDLSDKNKSLRKELKTANEELSEIKKKKPVDKLKPGAEGGGAGAIEFEDEENLSFDEIEKRLNKEYGIET